MTPYPLAWPDTIPRSKSRETGRFSTTLHKAMENVADSIRRFGTDSGKAVTNLVISSNVTLGASRPADPGVSIWFTWDGLQVCIPVDRYTTVESNLQAIHHIIEARRTELRHGTLALVRATFTGFLALPSGKRPWREVMGFPADLVLDGKRNMVEARFRELAAERHPDKGGSDAMMAELNIAKADALREVGA